MSTESSSDDRFQVRFWDDEAASARFSHPLHFEWLDRVASKESLILDYGCGYGRTASELVEAGYRNVTGFDTSRGMLDRLHEAHPEVAIQHSNGFPSMLGDESFDLVILFAVLTTIPDDASQRTVIREINRLLRPGGHIYVSDLPLQTDARRVARYRSSRPPGLPYGAFYLENGHAMMRHHDEAWFNELFADFDIVARRTLSVATMRGSRADAVQFLLGKRPS